MSGYTHCACRDCFEIAIGEAGEALCHGCEEAGCEAGAEAECDAPHAYCSGGDEVEVCPDCPACGGNLTSLGALGNLSHYRCRDCGADSSSENHPTAHCTECGEAF